MTSPWFLFQKRRIIRSTTFSLPSSPPPLSFFFERKSRLERRRGESSASILTLYHRRVPGDVTSRANSRGSYGNDAANTKPKSIRCTLSPAYCTRRPWGFVVLEVDERVRERSVWKMHRHAREERRNTWIWLWGSVQVLRPAIVFALIVRACSSSALDTFRAMAPMGPRQFCLLAFSRWGGLKKTLPDESIEYVQSFRNIRHSNLFVAWKERRRGEVRLFEPLLKKA